MDARRDRRRPGAGGTARRACFALRGGSAGCRVALGTPELDPIGDLPVGQPVPREHDRGERLLRLHALLLRVRHHVGDAALDEHRKAQVDVLRVPRLNGRAMTPTHQRPRVHSGDLRATRDEPLDFAYLREAERRVHIRQQRVRRELFDPPAQRGAVALRGGEQQGTAAGGDHVLRLHAHDHESSEATHAFLSGVRADSLGYVLDDRHSERRDRFHRRHEAERGVRDDRRRLGLGPARGLDVRIDALGVDAERVVADVDVHRHEAELVQHRVIDVRYERVEQDPTTRIETEQIDSNREGARALAQRDAAGETEVVADRAGELVRERSGTEAVGHHTAEHGVHVTTPDTGTRDVDHSLTVESVRVAGVPCD